MKKKPKITDNNNPSVERIADITFDVITTLISTAIEVNPNLKETGFVIILENKEGFHFQTTIESRDKCLRIINIIQKILIAEEKGAFTGTISSDDTIH